MNDLDRSMARGASAFCVGSALLVTVCATSAMAGDLAGPYGLLGAVTLWLLAASAAFAYAGWLYGPDGDA